MDTIKSFIIKNKMHVIYISIIVIICALFYLYFKHQEATVPIQSIKDVTEESIEEAQKAQGVYTSKDDVLDVVDLIKKEKAPTQIYYTYNQKDADNQAQALAKNDKADYVFKETTVINTNSDKTAAANNDVYKPNIDANNTDTTTTDNTAGNNDLIQNNYYAITQEKKHRIAAGATVVNSKTYADLSYTNRDLTYTLHSKDFKNIDGASVDYTFAKW